MDKRKERLHKIEICDQMINELVFLKSGKQSLALKLAKKKDLKEIKKMKKELIKQRFKNG